MKMTKIQGIYIIKNKINGKIYIGSSSNINNRIKQHKYLLRKTIHKNKYLQNAWNKYGESNFEFLIIKETVLDKDSLLKLEQKYIDKMDKKLIYNLTLIAKGGGSDVLKKECYVLNLDGDIIYKCEGINKALNLIGYKHKSINSVNKKNRLLNKFRIVTIDFYDNKKDIILSWSNKSFKQLNKKIKSIKRKIC